MIHLIFSFLVFIHPIYISSTNVVVSDEILEIKIKLFRDDLEDGLRDFHGFSISIDSLNKIEKNKSLINQYINDKLTLIINNEKINFFIINYSLTNDVFEVYFKQIFTKKTKDIKINNQLLIEIYSEQSNIMFLDISGKKYYDNFTASKTEKALFIK
mgnify:FL=1|tara:strand:- start:285 stop:755 length:471 start_codon:yes stop_codon:yes gene_type:complete